MKGKRTGVLLIAFGVLLAIIVGGLVFVVTSQAAKPTIPMEDIVVAAQEIPERTIIPANAVAVKQMPVEVLPAGTLKRADEVVGSMSLTRIGLGEAILASKLADTKGRTGMSFMLEQGKVVVSFPASNIVGLGLIRPGDAVDLLVTYKPASTKVPTAAQGMAEVLVPNVTQTTMQNLKVLTIGPATQPGGQQQQANQSNANIVTFAVDPQDALFLKAIKDAESLEVEMVLRSATDDKIHQTEPVSIRGVLDRYGIRTSAEPSSNGR